MRSNNILVRSILNYIIRKRQAVRVDSLPFYFCQLLLFADSAATYLVITL